MNRNQNGSALVVVLWTLALLSAVMIAVGATARTEARIGRNAIDHARAHYACEAGLHQGIFWLLDPSRRASLAVDGRAYAQTFDEYRLGVAITDEGGKVDLNEAPPALIAAAFIAAGLPPERALRFADAVLDWRDKDELRQPEGGEATDYRRLGVNYGPRNGPFEAMDEIRHVLGMDDEIYRRAAPLLTIHSGAGGIDPWAAPAALLRAMPGLDRSEIEGFLQARANANAAAGQDAPPLNDINGVFTASLGLAYTVAAAAATEGGARTQCSALIWLTGRADDPYAVLAWRGS